jgi:hypothetical protein
MIDTLNKPTVELSGISTRSSGTLKDLILSFTEEKERHLLVRSSPIKSKEYISINPLKVLVP